MYSLQDFRWTHPFSESIIKSNGEIYYDGLPFVVDIPLIFLRVSHNLENMYVTGLLHTKILSGKMKSLSDPDRPFIWKVLTANLYIDTRFWRGYSANIHHRYSQEISVIQIKDRGHNFSCLRALSNGSLKVGTVLGGIGSDFGGLSSFFHLAQLAIVNRRDHDVCNEQEGVDGDKPRFSGSNISLKLYGGALFLIGTVRALLSHFLLLWSVWSHRRLRKRLILGIGGWFIAAIMIWHGAILFVVYEF